MHLKVCSSLSALAFSLMSSAAFAAPAAVETQTTSASDASAAQSPATIPAPATDQAESATREAIQAGDDIVVTARRRSETTLDVPVSVAAVSGEQLANKGANSLIQISNLVPGLIVADNANSGAIALRGVSSSTGSSGVEQAVSINVDNIAISYAAILRLGYFDLAQVEVLKGPQALFFGKNATAGIIALKSADPTPTFEGRVTAGYEFVAREYVGEMVASGPVTDTLGARIAVRYGDSRGYFRNLLPRNSGAPGAFGPTNRYKPGDQEIAVRGTLKWEPDDKLMMRVKAAYNRQEGNGIAVQTVYCPNGAPQITAGPFGDDCKANRNFTQSDIDPVQAAYIGTGTVPSNEINLFLGTADVEYAVSDGVTLTSTTGYFQSRLENILDNGFSARAYFGIRYDDRKTQFSEEVRATTDFADSPVNGMVGMIFINDKFDSFQATALGAGRPPSMNVITRAETYSGFAQARWNIIDDLELSGGARYTRERKSATVFATQTNSPRDVTNFVAPNSILFEDLSPEATLAYRPTPDTNIYASYKEGYKAGGYQYSVFADGPALLAGQFRKLDYDKENVKGVEGGIKSLVLDRQLRLELAAYRYVYQGIQVTRFDPVTAAIGLSNADRAVSKGIEFTGNLRPRGIAGLTLNGSVSYNSTKYGDFFAPCFTGQTIAEGCAFTNTGSEVTAASFATTGVRGTQQDLTGKRLPRAPAWTGAAGLSYDRDIGALRAGFDASANYSSTFYVAQERIPENFQDSYWTVDLGLRIGDADDRWQVAFNVRNLTNEFIQQTGFQLPMTGNGARTGSTTLGGRADSAASLTTGREFRLRTTFRF